MLRKNSITRNALTIPAVEFLIHAVGAIERILPHVETSAWEEPLELECGSFFTSSKRNMIRFSVPTISGHKIHSDRSLRMYVTRKRLPTGANAAKQTIDTREHQICDLIAKRTDSILQLIAQSNDRPTIEALKADFDENVVAEHLKKHHNLPLSFDSILREIHLLSEQSYENKALAFGCVFDPRKKTADPEAIFPTEFLKHKKFKALSDGFRTAYHVSRNGRLVDFVDLERVKEWSLTEKHYFPEWSAYLANFSTDGKCGVALSRQGDILIFDEGTLRFTFRFGKWQYWNHSHLINILRDKARAQRVPPKLLGRVVGTIYRAALDISFRRSGGLFVILHNKGLLGEIVSTADSAGDGSRTPVDREFDAIVNSKKIQGLRRPVLVELASLDGAVVIENSGAIRAFGAVLRPRQAGKLTGTEGSRTKAAIGASNYGLAIKISSDGDITAYHHGEPFIRT